MTTIGNTNTAVTLSAASPSVTITGQVFASAFDILRLNGYSSVLYAAVQGGTHASYNILITSGGGVGSQPLSAEDCGIVLATPGIITNNGAIESGSGIVVAGYAAGGYIHNTGLINGESGIGILTAGATGINNSGTISALATAIFLYGGGNLANSGDIFGATAVTAYGVTSIYNRGTMVGATGEALYLYGGSLSNKGVMGGETDGVDAVGAAITNAGTIGAINRAGIALSGSSSVNNAGGIVSVNGPAIYGSAGSTTVLQNAASGKIGSATGIDLATGIVINAGIILGEKGPGITFRSGGTIINTGDIAGGVTAGGSLAIAFAPGFQNVLEIVPQSQIAGLTNLYGSLVLGAAGPTAIGTLNLAKFEHVQAIDVTSNWVINATQAIAASVYNNGNLTAGTSGVALATAAPVYNYGTITGAAAAFTSSGGYTYNTGHIAAAGIGIQFTAPGYIINAGQISAATAIQLAAKSQFYNYAGGALSGGVTATTNAALYNYAGAGITAAAAALSLTSGAAYNAGYLAGADGVVLATGTVRNLGTIAATTYAVDFLTTSAKNRLILTPGAVTTGAINLAGGGLDLKSGHSPGTLAAAVTAAAAVTLESRANWDLAAALTLPALTYTGTLFDRAGLTLTGPVTGAGTLVLDANLTLKAAAAATQKLAFSPTAAETLKLTNPASFSATIQNFTLSDTIDLATIPLENITGETLARNILTLTEATATLHFTFASLPTQDTFALTQSGAGTALTLSTPAAPAGIMPLTNPLTTPQIPTLTLQP